MARLRLVVPLRRRRAREDEQRRYEREDEVTRERIEHAIRLLPERPSKSDVERVLREQRREYVLLAKRNGARLERVGHSLRQLVTVVAAVGFLFVCVQAILGVATVSLQHQESGTSRRALATAQRAAALGRENRRLTRAIEQQRIDSVWESCQAQNVRHDRTVARLRDEIRFFSKHPVGPQTTAAELKVSARASIRLIDALVPVQDCRAAEKVALGEKAYGKLIFVRPYLPPTLPPLKG